jgi:hypothetical protein
MSKKNRTRICAVALTTLAIGACNGELKVDSSTGALDGGETQDGASDTGNVNPDTGSGDTGNSDGAVVDGATVVCPDSQPIGACPTHGQVCGYGPVQCFCWGMDQNAFASWNCLIPESSPNCPTEQPATGSSCSGHADSNCFYPNMIACSCALSGGGNWECAGGAPPQPSHPTTLDETKPINQLTDAEREAWCEWYLVAIQGPGLPDPPLSPLTPDGLATQTGCTKGDIFDHKCAAIIPELPPEYCKGNLALSTCEAPVSKLSDCVLTVAGGCWPAPYGCGSYLSTPGCAGTMAIHSVDGPDSGKGNCTVDVQ